jgi:hypothetical protein
MLKASGIVRTQIAPKAGPQVDGLYVENEVGAADFGVVKRTIDQDAKVYSLPFTSVRVVTADVTLTAEDNGAVVYVDSADPVAVTVPTPFAGLRFRVIFAQADNAHEISTGSAVAIAAKGLTAVAGEDLVNSTSAAGDTVVLTGITSTLYHAVLTGTFTKA